MNLYIVDAGEQSYVEEIDPEIGGPRFYFRAVELVAAKSRGQAHSFMAKRYRLDFTEKVHIFLIRKHVRRAIEPAIDPDGSECWTGRAWYLGWSKLGAIIPPYDGAP
jgi:hypothetical protein